VSFGDKTSEDLQAALLSSRKRDAGLVLICGEIRAALLDQAVDGVKIPAERAAGVSTERARRHAEKLYYAAGRGNDWHAIPMVVLVII